MAEIDLILDRMEKLAVELGRERAKTETAEANFAAASEHAAQLQREPRINPESVIAMLNFMAEGRKIDAIRMHRQMTGWGLKESKDAIEAAIVGAR